MPVDERGASASPTSSSMSLLTLVQETATATGTQLDSEKLQSAEVGAYLKSLSSLPLSDLRLQPQQLQLKSDSLRRQLSELCINQTDAFISIYDAQQSFAPALSSLNHNLSSLINHSLPALRQAADSFNASVQPILQQRQKIQNLADNYERGNLADLLEIPRLVQTCIRAAHYAEAIQLTDHLVKLFQLSSSSEAPPQNHARIQQPKGQLQLAASQDEARVLLSLLLETLAHLAKMKVDLLAAFTRPGLKLPAAKKTVTFLRRLASLASSLESLPKTPSILSRVPQLQLTENQLCLSFLKARIRSFNNALDAMGSPSSSSSEAYLRRFIDLWREEMIDTLAMAFALFAEVDSASTDKTASAELDQTSLTPSYLISAFASTGLDRLRDTLSRHLLSASEQLDKGKLTSDGSSIEHAAELFSNVHTQLSYASVALSRFGFDFGRVLFLPSDDLLSMNAFESAWLSTLKASLTACFQAFHAELDQQSFLVSAPKLDRLPSQWMLSSKQTTSAIQKLCREPPSAYARYEDLTKPNIELVDFPPLARLLNGILPWLDALQTFAPVNLGDILVAELDSQFQAVSSKLLSLARSMEELDPAALERPDQNLFEMVSDEEVASVQDLEEQAKKKALLQLLQEREIAVLARSIMIWQGSVVEWTIAVVSKKIYGLSETKRSSDATFVALNEWVESSEGKKRQLTKERQQAAAARQKAREEAEEAEKKRLAAEAAAEAERKRKEEEDRLRKEAEEKKEKEAEERKHKEEEEVERKRQEEQRRIEKEKEAEEAKLKLEAEEKARKEAEEQARLDAEEAERQRKEQELQQQAAEEERKRVANEREEAEKKRKEEEELQRVKEEDEREKRRKEDEARAKQEATEAAEAAARKKTEEEALDAARRKELQEKEDEAQEGTGEEGPTLSEQVSGDSKKETPDNVEREKAESIEPSAKSEQPSVVSAATSKKNSLAEKLQKRKEERERAAAAARALAAEQEQAKAQPAAQPNSTKEAQKSAQTTPTPAARDVSSQNDEGEVQDEGAISQTGKQVGSETTTEVEAAAASNLVAEPNETVGTTPDGKQEESDVGDAGEDTLEADADEDEGGEDGDEPNESNPTTPTIPSTSTSKKNKKKKKKKK